MIPVLFLRSVSDRLYTQRIISPKTTLETTSEMFARPVTPKDNLISTVEIINPVFLTI